MLTALLLASLALPTQGDGWKLPPDDLVRLVDAPPPPEVEVSPDARWMLVVERPSLPPLEDVARPWIPLAGIRVDPAANARHRTSFDRSVTVRDLLGAREARVALPDGARIASVRWSHDSRHFGVVCAGAGGSELRVVDAERPDEPLLVTERLNTVLGSGWSWMPDGASVVCLVVPKDRGAPPERSRVPAGPVVQETSGETTPLRTYQDLLRDEDDARLLEHYATSRLALWSELDGLTEIGEPGLVASVEPAPEGKLLSGEERLLVTEIHRPFSYLMPWYLFPQTIEVRDGKGRTVHVVAELPLAENVPIGGVRTGPRNVGWRPADERHAPTLVWVEALDGGDPDREVPHRDRWMELAERPPLEPHVRRPPPEPFAEPPRELLRTEERATGLLWTADPSLVVASEYDRDRRWTRALLVDLEDPAAAPVVLEDRSVHDRYGDPGDLVTTYDATGSRVVRQDGDLVYRSGRGSTPEGDRPFLDRQSLATLATERLWRCAPGEYEAFVALARSGAERAPAIVTRHESPTEPPNWRLRDLAEEAEPVALTSFEDPTPELRAITKELVRYQRADGVELSGTLYLPPGRAEGERLPLLVWAYPVEYTDASVAGQVSGSPDRFTRLSGPSHLFLVTQGYAVLDGATMPVVGDPETMNDTFVEQIVASAEAAVEAMVARGVADPARVAVGGHSYGAFMTANLLAHSDLFQAGIARSGAYNRTLTPFGFQSERRTLWEATEAYVRVSPFLHAHAIEEPLLLLHGEADSNSGTFPMQSERLFQALKGLGGTSRLVLLPHEDHGYRARESTLHVLAEMLAWLDRYLGPGEASTEPGSRF